MDRSKLSPRCKLCKLINIDEMLFVEVHKYVLHEHLSHSAVCKWLNKRVEVLNADRSEDEQIAKFNEMNFNNHFRKHITETDKMSKAVRDKLERQGKDFDARKDAIADSVREDVSPDVDTFQQLEAVVEASGALLREFEEWRRDKKFSLGMAETYQKMASDHVRMLKDLISLRTSNKVAGAAVNFALKQLVNEVAIQLNESAKSIVESLQNELPDSNLPEEIGKMVLIGVGDRLKEAVPEIRETVMKEYKIK